MAVKQNRFGSDRDSFAEIGVIQALFEDIPASEVGCCSGAQNAFDAARDFIKSMIENQCKLAGCSQEHWGFVHTEKCWFEKRAQFYRDRAVKYEQT
jgi:hypothetical protein